MDKTMQRTQHNWMHLKLWETQSNTGDSQKNYSTVEANVLGLNGSFQIKTATFSVTKKESCKGQKKADPGLSLEEKQGPD